jgi:hypothetical protein
LASNIRRSLLIMESIRYDFGSKSMSGYFVDQAASCGVTLMVYGKGRSRRGPFNHGDPRSARTHPGQMAGLDSEEGRSLNFTWGGERRRFRQRRREE